MTNPLHSGVYPIGLDSMPEQTRKKSNLCERGILDVLKFSLVDPNVIDQSELRQLVRARDWPHCDMESNPKD